MFFFGRLPFLFWNRSSFPANPITTLEGHLFQLTNRFPPRFKVHLQMSSWVLQKLKLLRRCPPAFHVFSFWGHDVHGSSTFFWVEWWTPKYSCRGWVVASRKLFDLWVVSFEDVWKWRCFHLTICLLGGSIINEAAQCLQTGSNLPST